MGATLKTALDSEQSPGSAQSVALRLLTSAFQQAHRLIDLQLQFRNPFELDLLFLFERLKTADEVGHLRAERGFAAVALAVLFTTRMKTMAGR